MLALALDRDEDVRAAVLEQATLPPSVLEVMTHDILHRLREEARYRLTRGGISVSVAFWAA